MISLDLVKLPQLMDLSSGRSEIVVGMVDGPVAIAHPDLARSSIRELRGKAGAKCAQTSSPACVHGTFVAGILCARRGSAAPAICPDCTLLVNPVFAESAAGNAQQPCATPAELASAILECIEAGARVLNLSLAVTRSSLRGEGDLELALDHAARRGVVVVAAAGNPADVDLLISAIDPQPQPRISTVIGIQGPVAPSDYCNGLMVPIVFFDQIYTFSRDALVNAIPRPEAIPAADFGPAAGELFDRIMLMTDNAGSTDEHRALNYLDVRYPNIYAKAAEAFAANSSLSGVEVRSSPLSGTRNVVEVVFAFTNRATDFTEKSFVRVDVTEQFPFLLTKLLPYYDR
jgi:subtilisin family serine protease